MKSYRKLSRHIKKILLCLDALASLPESLWQYFSPGKIHDNLGCVINFTSFVVFD